MKMNHLILALLLSIVVASGLNAQDKYQYATLQSIDNLVLWQEGKVEKFAFKKDENYISGTMAKLNELSEQGWEVYDVTEVLLNQKDGICLIKYHLRKKKN